MTGVQDGKVRNRITVAMIISLSAMVLAGCFSEDRSDHPDSAFFLDLRPDSSLDVGFDGSCANCPDTAPDMSDIDGGVAIDANAELDGFDDGAESDQGTDLAEVDIPSAQLVSGQVRYLDRPYDRDGYLDETPLVGAPWVRVDLAREADGRIIASVRTDDLGAFTFNLAPTIDEPVRLDVWAEVTRTAYALSVVDRRWYEPYVVSSESFDLPGADEPPISIDVDIEDEELAPAFNIANVASLGLEWLISQVEEPPDNLPDLTVLWQHGKESPCGTCYFASFIDLQGSLTDPDGYDDDIVLHELGHFVQQTLSADDSPGGSHDGTPTDPLLAFSEGFATFFSCWARQSPTYQDYLTSGWKFREHETLGEELRSTSNGELDGLVSEILVTSLMWDLFDDSPDEGHDSMSGSDIVTRVMFDHMVNPDRWDVGITGIDLADFLAGARCQVDDVDPLQDIVDLTGYPYDLSINRSCP